MADQSGSTLTPIVSGHELRRNVLGLPAITFQGITHMAPAVGVILSAPFIATFAGAALPLAFVLALVISLLIASSIAQLAKHLPSAGGYYTYASRGIHPKLGFLTAWLYFLYDPVIPSLCTVVVGQIFHDTLKSLFGVEFPWYLFTAIVYLGLGTLTFLGIRPSVRTAIGFALAEIGITVALSLSLIAKHGVTAHDLQFTFSLAGVPTGLHGLAFGLIFAVLSYTGFESTAPLAEETRDPRRNVKWAVLLSTIVVGVYYALFSFATVIGWGADATIKTFGTATNPYYTLSSSVWGGPGSFILLLAILNSAFGCSLAGQNAVIRVYYKMGLVGVLPGALGRVHPQYRTPYVAIIVQTIISFIVGLGLGFWLGPVNTFGFLGTMVTVGLIFVYGAGMIAVPIFYRREHPTETNLLLTYVFPIIGVVLLIPILYASLVPPPPFPLNLPPYVDIAWFLIGLGVLAYLSRTRPRQIEAGATAIFVEAPDEPALAGGSAMGSEPPSL